MSRTGKFPEAESRPAVRVGGVLDDDCIMGMEFLGGDKRILELLLHNIMNIPNMTDRTH